MTGVAIQVGEAAVMLRRWATDYVALMDVLRKFDEVRVCVYICVPYVARLMVPLLLLGIF